ncbi:MAG: hypothetical protein AAB726_00940 [Patescibacteria group bacterium]
MTKNPFYNALFAIAYIIVLVSTVSWGQNLFGGPDESIFYPMAALGTLVLSAALMAYLFFYQPVLMLIDGEREKAVKLFLQTVGVFAGAVVVILIFSQLL